MTEMENYFKDLQEQIVNKELWEKDRFLIYDYEAGSGKSRNTFKYLGEMTKSNSYKVLYVQRFCKENDLGRTVAIINEHAGMKVAKFFTGEEAKKTTERNKAKDAQILCLTHKMYVQFCKGKYEELWKERNILIIDEYPDLLEKVSLNISEVGYLWMMNYMDNNEILTNLIYEMRKSLMDCRLKSNGDKTNELLFTEFKEPKFVKMRGRITNQIESMGDKKEKEILEKIEQVLANGCYFYEDAFHTFNNKIQMVMVDNNIILDANGGFDYRYTLSRKFHVRKQPKFYDYSPSNLIHMEIKTTKKELASQINLPEKTFNAISPEQSGSTLFITDKVNKEIIEKKLSEYLLGLGFDTQKVKDMTNEKLQTDYFGNIVGVNTYKDFDNVVVMKTPNFDYLTYALTYMYYRKNSHLSVNNVQVFQHKGVERIRKTVIAGEIYQALKRVNRDNSRSSNMYVLSDNLEVVNLVLAQLPGIQYKKINMQVNNKSDAKNGAKTPNKFDQQVEATLKVIMEAKSSGATYIQKKAIREKIGVSDKSNFSRVMKAIQVFIEVKGFKMKGQKIILI